MKIINNILLRRSMPLIACAALLLPAWTGAQHEPVYFETDFTNYTLGSIAGQHDWTENSSGGSGLVTIITAGTDGAPTSPSGTANFLKAIRPNTAETPWGRQTFLSYGDALRGGMLRLSYTAALDWGSSFTNAQVTLGGSAMGMNGIKTGFHFGESTGATNRYLYVMDKNGAYHWLNANPDEEGMNGITRNAFYRFDIILNIDTRDYTVTVYDMDDRKLDSVSLNDWQHGTEELMFNRIHVGLPGGSANDTLYIDEIMVTIPEPGTVAIGVGAATLFFCLFAHGASRRKK